jgi:opacity protein-like surface antigen
MKQVIICCLLLWISSLTLTAQKFHGGILAGFTASQVDGDSYAGFNKGGFQGGVFVTASLIKNLGARLEIKYTSRGARNPSTEDNTAIYVLRLHYIDLPIMATLAVKKLISFELGVVPGYMFAASGEDDGGTMPADFLVDFKKFDMTTLIGLNINITPKLSANFRYSYSIFSIRDQESAGSYYNWFGSLFGYSSGDYNNYLSFGINYLIK